MAYINFNNMKKIELKTYLTGYCRHRHRYSEHPNCFLEEQKHKIRSGYLDIETSNLKADFGIILSYCIKDGDSKKIYSGVITKKELIDGILDKDITQRCINDMYRFDRIVTYYGTRFDIPFIRSRAIYWKLSFPEYSVLNHKDVYYMVKSKLCLHRSRLETACDLMGFNTKTHLDGKKWTMALTGNKEALGYILDHNKKDVIMLEKLYKIMRSYVKDGNRSI